MSLGTWAEVDRYLADTFVSPDPCLEAVLAASAAAGLPEIHVAPVQGKFLHLVARMCRARRILEIGTLAGYSTIWLARALPVDGKIVTLEVNPRHAEVARRNFAQTGLADAIEFWQGRALDLLPQLESAAIGPFDLVFIDADKACTPEYFSSAMRLTRPGSVIIVDNVVREGAVIDAASTDSSVQGVRRLNELGE